MKIADFMIRDLVTLLPTTEINAAVATLVDRQISGAPVVDGAGRLVGVLSMKDCLKAALHASYHQEWGGTVADFMAGNVETLDVDMDLIAAAEHFTHSSYRRFPVLQNGRLVGQISRGDVLKALSELW